MTLDPLVHVDRGVDVANVASRLNRRRSDGLPQKPHHKTKMKQKKSNNRQQKCEQTQQPIEIKPLVRYQDLVPPYSD